MSYTDSTPPFSISVITVTLNSAKVLPRLIDSLRRQTDRDFEWIIADGASTDGTVALIQSADDVVNKWVSEPDFGIYHALNKALQLCSGKYYLVLGADDHLFDHAIAEYRQCAFKSKADIITAGIVTNGKPRFPKGGGSWLHGMFAYVSGHSVGSLICCDLHEKFGKYSLRFPVAADMLFLKKACKAPTTRLYRASFLAGEHGNTGISNLDKAATFCDCFRVQLETEPRKLLQIIIFLAKIAWRAPDLVRSRHDSI